MKKITFLSVLILGLLIINQNILKAQAPNSFKYQAVVRDASGNPLANEAVEIVVDILQGSAVGTSVFSETHDSTTNQFGLVNLNIGAGNTTDFANIDWGIGPYFVQITVGGDILGTSQLLSVPYALHCGMWNKNSGNLYYNAGNVGINTDEPNSALEVVGNTSITGNITVANNATIGGDLTVAGTLTANISIESIEVGKITGLLGSGYSAIFPDVIDNTATLEVSGVFSGEVVVISTVGTETERISTPLGVHPVTGETIYQEAAGPTMEYPLVFETDNASDIAALQAWFDSPESRDASLIVDYLNGTEFARWNFLAYDPDSYETGNDGRTRFTMVPSTLPDINLNCVFLGVFGNLHAFNPETDEYVEISGVSMGDPCTPAVEVDYVNRTITLTFDYLEGSNIYAWVENIVDGSAPSTEMSIVETDDGITEISRRNYYYVIPIKYEHITGFGLNTKLKARLVIAYGFWEDA